MYKAIIIGCGRIGAEYDFDPNQKLISTHAGAYSANPKTDLTAVCDLDIKKAEKAQKKWNIPVIYQDYKAMLEQEKPDIISICTWEDTHAEIVKHCAKYSPKAILCEKPIAPSVEEAQEIIQTCQDQNITLQVNYMRRFSPLYQEIASFIKEGRLGQIQKISGHYGNGLMTNASHLIDLAHLFLSETFTTIQAQKSQIPSAYVNDPNYAFLAKTPSGTHFSLLPQDSSKYLSLELKIWGTLGAIRLTKNGYDLEFFVPKPHSIFPAQQELTPATPPFKNKPDGRFLENSIESLLTTIETNTKPLCTGEDALKTLEFVLQCKKNL
ncbi:Gfo/Idh/MocA family oxidoreductase [Patescibacteria group bacterium]|nr:Gfo/Idh/MocA family oxidoreductase [Patescibacteria group bacterium]